jgi:hypothetical protein
MWGAAKKTVSLALGAWLGDKSAFRERLCHRGDTNDFGLTPGKND